VGKISQATPLSIALFIPESITNEQNNTIIKYCDSEKFRRIPERLDAKSVIPIIIEKKSYYSPCQLWIRK